ncbi:MAG TPA: SpoIIE family protein phosphatase [Kofleriaceae bacterium]|nr:SpoIIE family protein phosphatase [Kofleriaceae bacterium]
MHELWSSASYEPHLLSLPFAFAPAAMLIVFAYALVIRGAPVLRRWLLVHFAALLPYATAIMLSPSIRSERAAYAWFRIAGAFIPMAAAAGGAFQLALLGSTSRRGRIFVWSAVVVSAAWIVVGAFSDAVILGVRFLPAGLWFADAGPFVWLALLQTFAVTLPGFIALGRAAVTRPPSHERRQLRLVLAANLITYAGLTDVMLAYGIGVFPLGWLLSGIGSLLVVRALIVEDLLRARAFDTTAPRLILHLAAAILLGWIALDLLGSGLTWWGDALALALCFAGVRVTIATIGLLRRGARGAESTLDRLVGQLVVRARAMRDESEVAQHAIDVIELGVGKRVGVLVAAAEDWGWTTAAGERIADASAPDPLLAQWLAEQGTPRFADDIAGVPDDLRPLLAELLDRHAARAIFPVTNRDELLALVIAPRDAGPLRGRALAFVERAAERLGEALVYVRMAQRAARRAQLAREVELAATVQAQLLPDAAPHACGEITVVGSWLPATRCAGDFWGYYPVGARTLVVIGDVTGHGVASATVTAAAAAACEVVVRRDGAALELASLVTALDAAVRRVGGGQLAMTCFAALLDPEAREIHFVSCGHPAPYLCRIGDQAELELLALVGRGNPLGTGRIPSPRVQHRPLRAGDLVVWYTDGVIDAQDPAGEAFGDRRLQRMLRRLDRAHLSPPGVHAIVHAGVAAHRAGQPRNDDETLVVAQWQPPIAAELHPAREVSA